MKYRGPNMIKNCLLFITHIILISFCVLPASADFEDGIIAYKQGDFHKAFIEFKLAAKNGNVNASYNLGNMYCAYRDKASKPEQNLIPI